MAETVLAALCDVQLGDTQLVWKRMFAFPSCSQTASSLDTYWGEGVQDNLESFDPCNFLRVDALQMGRFLREGKFSAMGVAYQCILRCFPASPVDSYRH